MVIRIPGKFLLAGGVPVNSSHGQLVTAQNRITSWPAVETPCCDELTGASNAVLSLLWRV